MTINFSYRYATVVIFKSFQAEFTEKVRKQTKGYISSNIMKMYAESMFKLLLIK